MKRRYWVLRALACLAACMAGAMSAGPAVAYFDHYLGGTIVGTLTPAQVTALTDVFRRTLEQGADRTRLAFRLPPDARKRPVEGCRFLHAVAFPARPRRPVPATGQ
ncbi:hypothetical protein [Cupriavidus necator]|uniref:hypothetical protein n=1 Tax=Cupriavidus necator TaxID=106590 RepID=UPI001E50619D|nr:hypothetical protein [Cupriavidus necator]